MYSWRREIAFIVLSTIVVSCFFTMRNSVVSSELHRSTSNRHIAQDIKIRKRVDNMNRMCKKLGNNGYGRQNDRFSSSILVDDKQKFLFCIVNKVASRNFKKFFLSLSNNAKHYNLLNSEDVKNLTFLDSFSPTEVNYRLNHYNKVIFVREPLERLVSAFRCKFIRTNTENAKKRANRIMQRYRNNSSDRSFKSDLTFTEFIHFLVDTIENGTNAHWRPVSDHCHPCFIKYNYIGKLETLEEDLNGFLKSLDIEDHLAFKRMEIMHAKTSDVMADFYKTVQPEIFQRLLNIYLEDYVLFDYEVPTQEQIMQRLV